MGSEGRIHKPNDKRAPQRGLRPKTNKIGDIDLSDQEEDHIIKDSKYQRKEKLGAHIQKVEENQKLTTHPTTREVGSTLRTQNDNKTKP